MNFYRVVISYKFNGLALMTERAVKADTIGRALEAACAAARIDRCEPGEWRAFVEQARGIDSFSHEALALPVVNGRGESVREALA